jgi:hypothetical protein
MDLYQTGGTSPPTMTDDQHRAANRLRGLPGRYRVTTDREGWPLIPGRTGQIETHDPETLAVFTDRPRMIAKLLGLPGVRRHQTGDTEARLLFPPSSFPVVALLIGARRRRSLSPDAARTLGAGTAYRPTKCPQ